jgi:hypothetical protein
VVVFIKAGVAPAPFLKEADKHFFYTMSKYL